VALPPSDILTSTLLTGSGAWSPLAASPVRMPRLLVLANGVPMTSPLDATVTSTGFFGADRFRVRAALTDDMAIWAGTASLFVDVQAALSPLGGFVSLVQGQADTVSLDPLLGTVTIEGRDLSAALMQARTQETFANRTSSDIATVLAGRHGLAAAVQATTTPVGRYWELEHDRLTLNAAGRSTTEWDLLVTLALHETFDLWVSGTTLYFQPPDTVTPPALLFAAPTPAGPANVTSLQLDRELTFAGDIVVTVKSWHSRAGTACMQTAQTERGSGSSQTYVYVIPNLTPDDALQFAQNKLAELTAHELILIAEMPGELSLWPRAQVQLLGTGTLFDTTFTVDEVERRLHSKRGFSQRLRARASSPLA